MSWEIEEKKLRLSHKLELRRMWWKATVAVITLGLMTWAVDRLTQEYQSRLRTVELEREMHLEVAKTTQVFILDKRLKCMDEIDSLFSAVSNSYNYGLWRLDRKPGVAAIDSVKHRLEDDCIRLLRAIDNHDPYLPDDYANKMRDRCVLFMSLLELKMSEWPKFFDMLMRVRLDAINLFKNEVSHYLSIDSTQDTITVFNLTRYNTEPYEESAKDSSRIHYLIDNMKRFSESRGTTVVLHGGDSTNH